MVPIGKLAVIIMTTGHSIYTFLKFGQESDIYDLLNNGTIYMNPIQKFRQTEDNQLRGDKYEGVTSIKNYPPGQFEIKSIGYKGDYLNLHLIESYEKVLGNIYSLYCVSSIGFPNRNDIQIDKRVKRFGTHYLMVTNCGKFLTRLSDGLKATGLYADMDFVKYYDKKLINGKITVYQKPDSFEWQKEYRLYVNRLSILPYSFKIGSLHDIAVVFPIDKIDEMPFMT